LNLIKIEHGRHFDELDRSRNDGSVKSEQKAADRGHKANQGKIQAH